MCRSFSMHQPRTETCLSGYRGFSNEVEVAIVNITYAGLPHSVLNCHPSVAAIFIYHQHSK